MDTRLLRTIGIVALVVLIVVLGLPLAIGMGGMGSMGRCPDCQIAGGSSVFTMCLAILGTLMLLALSALGGVVMARLPRFAFVSSGAIERPPRFPSV